MRQQTHVADLGPSLCVNLHCDLDQNVEEVGFLQHSHHVSIPISPRIELMSL